MALILILSKIQIADIYIKKMQYLLCPDKLGILLLYEAEESFKRMWLFISNYGDSYIKKMLMQK